MSKPTQTKKAAQGQNVRERLEELRRELRAERISYDELHELQSLAEYIDKGDVELLEAAGVPEVPQAQDDDGKISRADWRELALSRHERMDHYRNHAEALAEELRLVLKHGSAGNESNIRAALAQWEGAK